MTPQSPTLVRKYLRSYMRNENFVLSPDQMDEFMSMLSTYVKEDIAESNLIFLKEMNEIAGLIISFKKEMNEMSVNDLRAKTTDELDVVMITTEEAVGQILECAEEIDNLVMEATDEMSEKLQGVSTRIYEASNFQDLNGQRITKVIKTFRELEAKIFKLLAKTESRMPDVDLDHIQKKKELSEHEKLLNGPQKPAEAFSQDDIDKLFSQG